MQRLPAVDVAIVIVYLAGMLVLGFFLGRKHRTDRDYFLGGRKLKWWMVGVSMVVSDIGALELVGVAGSAYVVGLSVANFDWIGCIPAMILAAFLFIPFYWKSGVFTIPEYLGRRYNDGVRVLVALLWGLFMVANLGIFLWTAANVLHLLVGWNITLSIVVTACVIGFYTFSGGLSAVVFTDTIQYFILITGSAVILVLAFIEVGGIDGLVAAVAEKGGESRSDFFHLILPADTIHPFSWSAVLFGLAFVLSPAYWIGNQAIVQRNLGCASERDAKKSVLFGAFLKLTIPFLIVIPGIVGFALFPDLGKGDDIFPTLLQNLLPPGLAGLVFAGFLAALMSSVDSYLNSASTLWTMDIYRKYFKKDASPEHLFRVGKMLTLLFIIMAIFLAPLTARFEGIFTAMQTLLSIFQGPTFAILLLGMIWKRANGPGAVAGLITGVLTSSVLFWIQDGLFQAADPFLYIAWWSFVVGIAATVVVSLLTPAKPAADLKNLTCTRGG
jgi:solute:Na+ symporter, SSS family